MINKISKNQTPLMIEVVVEETVIVQEVNQLKKKKRGALAPRKPKALTGESQGKVLDVNAPVKVPRAKKSEKKVAESADNENVNMYII